MSSDDTDTVDLEEPKQGVKLPVELCLQFAPPLCAVSLICPCARSCHVHKLITHIIGVDGESKEIDKIVRGEPHGFF